MPSYNMIPVSKLEPPANRMRDDTLYEDIDDLRASIHANGLQQPIGVKMREGNYEIIWGERRAICVTQLGWEFIPAMVYAAEEPIDTDNLMATENLLRKDANPAEEAKLWKRLLPDDPEGTIGLARRYHVSQTRIENLLAIESGDPDVWQAMATGRLKYSQAVAINKFEAKSWRLHALELCLDEGWTGDRVDKWRKEQRSQGVDLSHDLAPADFSLLNPPIPKEPQDICNLGNHLVPILQRRVMSICDAHMDIVTKGLQYFGEMDVIEQSGYLPEYKALLRKAERALQDNGSRNDDLQHPRGSGPGT
jgi:ParB/RepB/Spo0J family partition protein